MAPFAVNNLADASGDVLSAISARLIPHISKHHRGHIRDCQQIKYPGVDTRSNAWVPVRKVVLKLCAAHGALCYRVNTECDQEEQYHQDRTFHLLLVIGTDHQVHDHTRNRDVEP
jgi:hypothetical protein